MEIISTNMVKMTGVINNIWAEDVSGCLLVHAEIETQTRFEKLRGGFETQKQIIPVLFWQRHNKEDVKEIKPGTIVHITAELKNQQLHNIYGNWTRTLLLFVYDFTVLGNIKDDEFLFEQSKAKIYPERE